MVFKAVIVDAVKKHPSLTPLLAFVGLGVAGATFYTIRVAMRNPEISINRKGNPEPWNEFGNKQYKFYSPQMTEDKLKSKVPEY